MNKRFSGFLIAALLLAANVSFGQSRIAFLDATKILKKMPEAVDAETRLDQLVVGWNKEIGDLEVDLKRKRDDYDRKKLIMTDAERSSVELDITDLKKRIDLLRMEKYGTGGELYKQQAELMKASYDKLLKAIEEVALDGKYDYVLDRSSKDNSILYTNAKFDISVAVGKKLGLEVSNDIFNTLLNNPLNPGGANTQQNGKPQLITPDGSMPPQTPPLNPPPSQTPPIKH